VAVRVDTKTERAKQEQAELRIHLLGGFRVEWRGEPLPEDAWRRPQARTLIKLLASEQAHRLHREQIIELFWPEQALEAAGGRLRNLFYVVRRSLPPEAGDLVEQRGDVVALDLARVWIDADAFEERAHTALADGSIDAMETAVSLYGGELLPEERYAEWAEVRREKLAVLHRELLLGLARLLSQHGETESAVTRLRQVLALDPADEVVHRELMQLYAAVGNRREALRQYERCQEALVEHLGVEPDAGTEALRKQIETGLIAASASMLPPAVTRSWRTPLIGRERALDLVLVPPIPGKGRSSGPPAERAVAVLVRGEAGVGKTRLAVEAAREAGRRGCLALWGTCSAQAAYGPFVEALEQYAGGLSPRERAELARAHPEIARILPALDPDLSTTPAGGSGDELRLFAAVARFLTRLAAFRPVLLVLDDLQLADDASLALLTYLARLPLTGHNWLVLGTYRIEEALPRSALAATLQELQRSVRGRQVDLLRLGRRECLRLVEGVLGGPATEAVGEHIFATSLGNPLFAVELLGALRSAGGLVEREGGWQLAAGMADKSANTIPEQIVDLIASRIATLDEETQRLLSLASVVGMSVPVAVLSRGAGIVGRSVENFLDSLERAVEARVLLEEAGSAMETSSGGYSFQHPLFREVVYARLGTARRTHLHGVVAQAIEAVHPGDVEALAYHYDRSGNREKRVLYLEKVGDHARSIYANARAEACFRSLLSLLAPGDPAVPQVQAKLGEVLNLTARHDEALEILEAAAAAHEAATQRDDLGRVLAAIGLTHAARGTPEAAIGRLQSALSALDGLVSPVTLAGMAMSLGHVFYACARYADSLAAAERAETLSRPHIAEVEARRIHAQAEVRRAAALNVCGRGDEAKRVLEAAMPEVEASGDLDNLIRAVNNLGTGAQLAGDFEAHQRYQQQALEIAERLGDPARIAVYRAALGQAPLFTNDWKMPESLALAAEGYRELKALGASWHMAYAALYLGWILLWLGRWEEARPMLEESITLAGSDRQVVIAAQALLADTDLLEDRPEAVRARMEPLLPAAEADDDLDTTLVSGRLARALVRLGERAQARMLADRAVRVARRMGHPLYLADVLMSRGAVSIEDCNITRAEADLSEALALARGMGYGMFEAVALLFLGRLEAVRGNRAASERLVAESRALTVRLGGEDAARGIDITVRMIEQAAAEQPAGR
jgi:DNA-binding SARP family transcriptional activator/predicted ATPase